MSRAVIRDEAPGDAPAIRALVDAAFETAPHSSGTEGAILDRLRADGDLAISLVAEADGALAGQVALSPLTAGGEADWLGLGPVAVAPDRQRQGIGSALIREGLGRAEASGARGVALIGDPAYYSRFGFRGDAGLTYGEVPPAYVQALGFDGAIPCGALRYAPAFDLA